MARAESRDAAPRKRKKNRESGCRRLGNTLASRLAVTVRTRHGHGTGAGACVWEDLKRYEFLETRARAHGVHFLRSVTSGLHARCFLFVSNKNANRMSITK